MNIRLATRNDVPAILAISNHYALCTPANFAIEPETLASWQASFDDTHVKFPWLVANDESERSLTNSGAIIGFAKASPWQGRCAYAYSVMTSVYLAPGKTGRGIGKALYARLIDILRAQGYRSLVGGITLPNPSSVGLHESFGYKKVAHFPNVGWKFDRWHDVGYWELQLGEPATPPGKIRLVADVTPITV